MHAKDNVSRSSITLRKGFSMQPMRRLLRDELIPIKSKLLGNGMSVNFKGSDYPIIYPDEAWKATPAETRRALKDNLAMATTMHLPMIFNASGADYDSGRPLLEPYFMLNFLKDIPSVTEADMTDTAEAIRKWYNVEYRFEDQTVVYPSPDPVKSPSRAIVGLSFGKDSLLTFAVAREIGLDPEGVYAVEQGLTYEEKHKTRLAIGFKKEFGKQLHILKHDTGKLRDYKHLGLPKSDFGWGLQSTEYALDLIPFAYLYNAKYILFGNEQSCAATYMDPPGNWLVNPCYDQSHLWTIHIDQITQTFSGRTVRTGSLIEPIMDMMIQRTLAHRYPDMAKYQMSCFTENEQGRDYHWCHNCAVCAKMYLLCVASGINPEAIGLKQNMLRAESKPFFTLFGGRSNLPYANTDISIDEQLFAFYAASKKGVQGALVDEFKQSKLYQEAKDREDELFEKFCSLYDPISLPRELRDKVLSIYKEELSTFEL
jgi:hypothetical protein